MLSAPLASLAIAMRFLPVVFGNMLGLDVLDSFQSVLHRDPASERNQHVSVRI